MRSAALHLPKRFVRSGFSAAPVGKALAVPRACLVAPPLGKTREWVSVAKSPENRWQPGTGAFSAVVCTPDMRSRGCVPALFSRLFATSPEKEAKAGKKKDDLKSYARQLWTGDNPNSDDDLDSEFSSEESETTNAPRSSLRPLTLLDTDTATLRQAVRRFAEEEIRSKVEAMDDEGAIEAEVIEGLFKQGYLGMEIEEKYGGSAMSFFNSLVVIEELARVDPSVAALVDIHNTLINRALTLYGTEEQKEKFLPQLASNMLGSFCLSESESGSDAFALKATARRSENGDAWVLNGAKQWISTAREAGLFLVFASYDLDQGYRGITAFLVEAGTAGLEVGPALEKLGIKASSTCEVILNDVQVHDSCVLGEVGEGYKIAIRLLNEGRIGIAAQMLGLAKGAFETAMRYMHDRQQFGRKIADFQGVQFEYAKLATEIEAAALLTANAALLREAGQPFAKEAAMAKFKSSEVAQRVSSACIDFVGGNGFTKSFGLEKLFRDSKIGTIYEGTSNMQLQTIAKVLQREFSGSH
ncbi:short-chain-acyl-CoA dehydrogenase [Toxoplasma gondii VEG]|uniref:Short/branched chain specific acyl-CoA dehydrogenase, mitochondrial n=4 Tax=Toxoplasma gondii TaxID=5811 RepID=V4ZEC7_TOXGV|nr:short-chain-acyl-CoA dehydrogenase [Toxoplasma gondii VEG]